MKIRIFVVLLCCLKCFYITQCSHMYLCVCVCVHLQEDLRNSHYISSFLGADGVVIWGSTKSMESQNLCTTLHTFITSDFGPFIKSFTQYTQQCSMEECSSHGQCVFKEIPSTLTFLAEGGYGKQMVIYMTITNNVCNRNCIFNTLTSKPIHTYTQETSVTGELFPISYRSGWIMY